MISADRPTRDVTIRSDSRSILVSVRWLSSRAFDERTASDQ